MANQNFVDYVKLCCRSGKGGAGSTHMHRDRPRPKADRMEEMAGEVAM